MIYVILFQYLHYLVFQIKLHEAGQFTSVAVVKVVIIVLIRFVLFCLCYDLYGIVYNK